MAARLGRAVVGVAALAIGGLAWAQAPEPCCEIAGPIAWGEVAFLAEDILAVPVAEVVEADAAQRAEEAARRREWLSRPREERLDELVERDPDEGEAMYRFRRWVAERYLAFLEQAPPSDAPRRLVALAVELHRLHEDRTERLARIPLWRGDVALRSQTSHHGGLGGASWTLEMVNAWAGAHPGPRWIALWAWPDRTRAEPVAALIDDVASLRPRPLGSYSPLAWQNAGTLIALARRDEAWWLVRLRLGPDGEIADEAALAPAPSTFVSLAVVPGADEAVLANGFVFERFSLKSGARAPLRLAGRTLSGTTCGAPLAAFGRVWISEGPVGRRLLALGMKGSRLDLLEAQELPWSMGEPEWCSPLAAAAGRLVLARREVHRRALGGGAVGSATTPSLSLHLYDPERGEPPRALVVPPVETHLAARAVALSPGGRWLALRVDGHRVVISSLSRPSMP